MHRRRSVSVVLLGLLAVPLLGGCGRNGQDLPPAYREGIDTVSELTSWLAGVSGTFTGLTRIENLLPTLVDRTLGDCPRISAHQRFPILDLTFDYGDRCASPLAMGGNIAGAISLGFNLLQLEGQADFDRLSLAGEAVSGRLRLRPLDRRLNRLGVAADRLTIGRIGQVDGDFGLVLQANGALKMEDGAVELSRLGGSKYAVRLEDLRINPLRHGNPVPDGGRISFRVPVEALFLNSADVSIKFTDDTPFNGKVQIFVGPIGPIGYRLPFVR